MKRGIQSIAVDVPKRQRVAVDQFDEDEILATLSSLLDEPVDVDEPFVEESLDLQEILRDMESDNLSSVPPSVAVHESLPVQETLATDDSFVAEDTLVDALPVEETPAFQESFVDAPVVEDWRMRPNVPDDPKGYFTVKRFLELHCPFINTMLQQMAPQGVSPLSVSAINIQTTQDAGNVLAVVREFLLSITGDINRAARIAISMAYSRENVFAQKPTMNTVFKARSPRVLLFFKDVIGWALQQENVFTAEQLQAFWEDQLQSESPRGYLQVLFGVMYMVYLSDKMKVSRQSFSAQDQKEAAASLRSFIVDLPKGCRGE